MVCQLDSSGSSLRYTEVTTVPVTATLTVRDSEIATQKFYRDLERGAAHYYTKYYPGPSEELAVALRPRGGHPTKTDRRCCVISLVTTLTGNPAENTHS